MMKKLTLQRSERSKFHNSTKLWSVLLTSFSMTTQVVQSQFVIKDSLGVGSAGNANGELYGPKGVTTLSDGSVWVAESGNNRIQKFDANGNYVNKAGTPGNGDGQFNDLFGIAADGDGNVFVADQMNNRIQKFDKNGDFVKIIGTVDASYDGNVDFTSPDDIAVDAAGNIYVYEIFGMADGGNFSSRIQKLTNS